MDSGVNAYITKPFSAGQVQTKLLALTSGMTQSVVFSDWRRGS